MIFLRALFGVKNLEFRLQLCSGDSIWRLQIGNRLGGFNLVDPHHCFNRTTCIREYFIRQILKFLKSSEVSGSRVEAFFFWEVVCLPIFLLMPRMKSSICNVIFMRMTSPSVKNTHLRFERFYFTFSLYQRESPFAQCKESAKHLLTLQLSALVPRRWGCVLVWRMALLVPLESPASSWRSEKWRQILQLRREEYRACSSSDGAACGFFNISSLLCFLLSTCGRRRPYAWPNRFLSRCDLCFGQSAIHP